MATRLIKAWWGPADDEVAEGLDVASLDALLDQLEVQGAVRPFLVDLADDDGNVLTLGVGAPVTVLAFLEGSADPPYLTSFTDEPIVEESVWFDYAGAESEFGPEQIISTELGRSVVRAFAATGDRSGAAWSEV